MNTNLIRVRKKFNGFLKEESKSRNKKLTETADEIVDEYKSMKSLFKKLENSKGKVFLVR